VRIVGVVPAHDEVATIAETVTALKAFTDEVVVVDDGSTDRTAEEAATAGARVLRSVAHRGKGSAMEGALSRVGSADVWLFADGDLGSSAEALDRLVDEVVAGRADLALAVFSPGQGGGFGLVKRTAAAAVHALSGFEPREPLSGQRALSARCLEACRPLAGGFGVETAMLIDAARAGMRVIEIDVPGLRHRPSGRDLRGFLHRGRQGFDIFIAVLRRMLSRKHDSR